MNIYEKLEINKKIKKCLSLMEDGRFDEIDEIIDTINIKNNRNFDLFVNYINECKRYHSMKNSETGSAFYDYLNEGKEALDNDEYQKAIYFFNKALNITGDPLFYYYLGITYFQSKNYTMAYETLRMYVENSFFKLEESYEYLSTILKEIAYNRYEDGLGKVSLYLKKSDIYNEKLQDFKNVKSGIIFTIEKIPVCLNLDDEEISKLIYNGKVNDVIEIFYTSPYDRKITILALLYKNGYKVVADGLLKKYEDELKDNCPEFLTQLKKNKKLYLNQAKFKSELCLTD